MARLRTRADDGDGIVECPTVSVAGGFPPDRCARDTASTHRSDAGRGTMDRLCGASMLACSRSNVPRLAGNASTPGLEENAVDEAAAIVKRRRLLTTAEMIRSSFVSEGAEKTMHTVAVGEKHDRRCGDDPDVAPIRFRMLIDRAHGRVLWDNDPDVEMRPVPSVRF